MALEASQVSSLEAHQDLKAERVLAVEAYQVAGVASLQVEVVVDSLPWEAQGKAHYAEEGQEMVRSLEVAH